jgi:RIO-like serine/threonine protein kinase
MTPPFGRAELERCQSQLLNRGRFANSVVRRYRVGDGEWVVKDFLPKAWVVRNTYGRRMIRRELAALERLAGVRGVPQDAFLVDRHAIAYRFMAGATLAFSAAGELPASYFEALERLVGEIHARGIAHLDIRYRQNVLVLADGTPGVLDFQSCVRLDDKPRWLRELLVQVDLGGVYKHWLQKSPATMDEQRLAVYREHTRRRRFWVLHGYLIRPERVRKHQAPRTGATGKA